MINTSLLPHFTGFLLYHARDMTPMNPKGLKFFCKRTFEILWYHQEEKENEELCSGRDRWPCSKWNSMCKCLFRVGTCTLLLAPRLRCMRQWAGHVWCSQGDLGTWWWTQPYLERVSRGTFLTWDEMQFSSPLPSGCSQCPLFPICSCTVHSFPPQSSCPPCQGIHHACPCSSLESSEGHWPYLLWQGAFVVICATPGLTATQDIPSRAGQRVDFMCHEKCQDLNVFVVKEVEKGKFISFHWNDILGRFSYPWCFSLSYFLFFTSP